MNQLTIVLILNTINVFPKYQMILTLLKIYLFYKSISIIYNLIQLKEVLLTGRLVITLFPIFTYIITSRINFSEMLLV